MFTYFLARAVFLHVPTLAYWALPLLVRTDNFAWKRSIPPFRAFFIFRSVRPPVTFSRRARGDTSSRHVALNAGMRRAKDDAERRTTRHTRHRNYLLLSHFLIFLGPTIRKARTISIRRIYCRRFSIIEVAGALAHYNSHR